MWCPQIKDVTHVSRRRPGVSGRVVINDKPGEAGEETYPACQAACQATNGPDGENPIEQVERPASCAGSRACSRACVDFSTETGTCLGTFVASAVDGFIEPMTSPRAPLQFVGVVHRCFCVVKSGFFHFASLCRRIGSPPTYMMPEYVSQPRLFHLSYYVPRGVLSSVWPPLSNARALIHVSAPCRSNATPELGLPCPPKAGPRCAIGAIVQ